MEDLEAGAKRVLEVSEGGRGSEKFMRKGCLVDFSLSTRLVVVVGSGDVSGKLHGVGADQEKWSVFI